jgi:hypothetical protein
MRSSISDFGKYRLLCRKAAEDDLFFEVIRRHPVYGLVEALPAPAGQDYIDIALAADPSIRGSLDMLRQNDRHGGPILHDYEDIGRFSPATLRYIKVAVDLRRIFGSLDGYRIAEIGVGYGGQCRILSALNAIASYSLFDLPEPLELTRRYLGHFEPADIRYCDLGAGEPQDYDLVISNYAFSELHKDVQDLYWERVIARSRHGFMLYNQAAFTNSYPNFTYSWEEIMQRLPAAKVISSHPPLGKIDVAYRVVLIQW